jgi:hypothetical protein
LKETIFSLRSYKLPDTEAEKDDGIPFETNMIELKTQLLAQFDKSEVLKQQLMGQVHCLGTKQLIYIT